MIHYERLENDMGTLVIDKFDNEVIMSKVSYLDSETEYIWDNEDYLTNTLYPILERAKNDKLTDNDLTEIEDFEVPFDYLLENEGLDLLKEAIKRNWLISNK